VMLKGCYTTLEGLRVLDDVATAKQTLALGKTPPTTVPRVVALRWGIRSHEALGLDSIGIRFPLFSIEGHVG